MDIQPPGGQSAVWRAFRGGDLVAYGFTLMVFLDRLEALPEPLGAAHDFGVHPPARNMGRRAAARFRLPPYPHGSRLLCRARCP